jgi:hypothetical protein
MNRYTDRRGTDINARSAINAARRLYGRTAQLEGANVVGDGVAIWTVTSSSPVAGQNRSVRRVLGELYGPVEPTA